MTFSLGFCGPLMTANHIPQSNCHFNAKPFTGIPITLLPHKYALRSPPLKSFNYQSTWSSSLNDEGLSGDEEISPSKVGVLKCILREGGDDPWESLEVIDALQRLAIDYLFQHEIHAILQTHRALTISAPRSRRGGGDGGEIDLHAAALRFRLLRQQGYYVPADDVFKKFMDEKGNFEEELKKDIRGLTSLYEASKLCIHGEEDILEKAGNFSKQILHATTATATATATATDHSNKSLAKFVSHTLAHPHHISPSAFMVKNYFGDTQWMNKWISILQQLAKVEFNATQALHQNEILQLSKWWEETGLCEVCKFASRHQPVVWYAISLGFFSDPKFSEERVLLAKAIAFVYIIDDIFDQYGTLQQLNLFTQAVSRWDMGGASEELPDCIRLCLAVLYDVTNEISNAVNRKHQNNPTQSLKKAWREQCKGFLVQAEWVKSGKWATAEEYLKNGIITCGFPLGLIHAFHLLGEEGLSHQITVELLHTYPDIVSSSATILRLLDDIEALQGGEDGYDASYIEYYMKEHSHEGISIEATREHVETLISDAWKTLNGACLLPNNPFPQKFVQASLNTVRIFHLISESKSDQSSQNLKKLMASVLFKRVDVE